MGLFFEYLVGISRNARDVPHGLSWLRFYAVLLNKSQNILWWAANNGFFTIANDGAL